MTAEKTIDEANERTRFEAHFRAIGGNFQRHTENDARYASSTVQGWWRVWLAAKHDALTAVQAPGDAS